MTEEIEVDMPSAPPIVGFDNRTLGAKWRNPSPLYDRRALIQE